MGGALEEILPDGFSTHDGLPHFVEVIQSRVENHAPGEIGWRAVELLDAVYRSAQSQGRPVMIEELYE